MPGFETAVFPYTTDVPLLTRWGTPLLIGPGSIHVAHTDDEHVAIDELHHAVELYESLATQLHRRLVSGLVRSSCALEPDHVRTLHLMFAGTPTCLAVGGPHRGPDPVQLQPANRVRAGRQQR